MVKLFFFLIQNYIPRVVALKFHYQLSLKTFGEEEKENKLITLDEKVTTINRKMYEPEKSREGMKTPKNSVKNKYMWIHICTHSGVMCQESEKMKIFGNSLSFFMREKSHMA